MKDQLAIKGPNGKKITLSRDQAAALQYQQKEFQKKLGGVNKTLTSKYYEGETQDIKVAFKFKEDGSVDDLANPQLELSGKLAELDDKTREVVNDALYQFMLAMNNALSEKNSDGQAKIMKLLKESA